MSAGPRRDSTARYLVETYEPLEKAAEAIAGEQSCGTFMRLPGQTADLRARVVGVDQLHVNGLRSKFWEPDESVVASARACLAPFSGTRPIMPVFSSGQTAAQPPATLYGDEFTGSTDALECLAAVGLRAVSVTGVPSPEQFGRLDALRRTGAPILHDKVCSTFDSPPAIGSFGRVLAPGHHLEGREVVLKGGQMGGPDFFSQIKAGRVEAANTR
jgi:hypothetical protein